MMGSYPRDYIKRIKDTKKLAREKSTLWVFPLFDSLVISVLFSWELSVGSWLVLGKISEAGMLQESYLKFLWESSTYLFLVYFAIICVTILDKMIVIFIHVHAFLNKITFKVINKLDMWLWKKTGKDSIISSALLRLQIKFQSMSLKRRRAVVLIAGALLVLFYAQRLFGQ